MEEYLFKTLISFISLNAVKIMFKPYFKKVNTTKKKNFFVKTFSDLLPCLVPVFRWIWVSIAIIIGFCLMDDELVKKVNDKNKKRD